MPIPAAAAANGIVQFVDSISASPTVRLDLNNNSPWMITADGTSFTPPPLKYATVTSLLVDGEYIPASAYGNRTITLRLELVQATADGVATQMQALARELNRPSNILLVQFGSYPVFFRTFRADVSALDMLDDFVTYQAVTIDVPAEPFGLGLMQTLTATVVNDPAATGGLYFDVASPLGDVDTPAYIEVSNSSATRYTVAATRKQNVSLVVQAESADTLYTDTALQANSASYSGAGSNYLRTTFATNAGMAGRFSFTWPPSPTHAHRGTYRVYGRVAQTVATDVMKVQVQWSTAVVNTTTLPQPATGGDRMLVDLGLVSYPPDPSPASPGFSSLVPDVSSRSVVIAAQRVSGTGSLDFDYLVMVPADEQFAVVSYTATAPVLVLDAPNEAVYRASASLLSSGVYDGQVSGSLVGRLPMLTPNTANRILLMLDRTTVQNILTDSASVTLAYWPRYLAPGATA